MWRKQADHAGHRVEQPPRPEPDDDVLERVAYLHGTPAIAEVVPRDDGKMHTRRPCRIPTPSRGGNMYPMSVDDFPGVCGLSRGYVWTAPKKLHFLPPMPSPSLAGS